MQKACKTQKKAKIRQNDTKKGGLVKKWQE
jgi:hypothetical protein